MTKLTIIPFLIVTALSANACVPVLAVGAGTAVGTGAAREGGLSESASDTRIATYINDEWLHQNRTIFRKLSVTVFEGRVMITGTVQRAEDRDTAIRIAWQPQGVRQVINEVRIEPAGGISGFTRDSWISTQFRSRLIADKEISSLNYKYEVDAKTIYVIGVAKDQAELNRVLNHGRSIEYVRDVISYVRLRSDPIPNIGSTNSGNAARQ